MSIIKLQIMAQHPEGEILTFEEEQRTDLLRRSAELMAIGEWQAEQTEKMGEMTVEEFPLTDGTFWKATHTDAGQVEDVSGAQFKLKGQLVTKYKPGINPADYSPEEIDHDASLPATRETYCCN